MNLPGRTCSTWCARLVGIEGKRSAKRVLHVADARQVPPRDAGVERGPRHEQSVRPSSTDGNGGWMHEMN